MVSDRDQGRYFMYGDIPVAHSAGQSNADSRDEIGLKVTKGS